MKKMTEADHTKYKEELANNAAKINAIVMEFSQFDPNAKSRCIEYCSFQNKVVSNYMILLDKIFSDSQNYCNIISFSGLKKKKVDK